MYPSKMGSFMGAPICFLLMFFAAAPSGDIHRQVVVVPSGPLSLTAVLWTPAGGGPFPAVLFNHGGGRGHKSATFERDQDFYRREPDLLGPVFARHGYLFLYLYRRGDGLSAGQGTYSGDILDAVKPEEFNRTQVRLLETDQLSDARAGLAYLRSLGDVDRHRVAVAGHSFGGSLTLLTAEADHAVNAVVTFGAAAASWPRSPELQKRLIEAAHNIKAPVLLIHAANDYSTEPGHALDRELRVAHRLVIYPAVGTTTYEGHNFLDAHPEIWQNDVFAFLNAARRVP